MLWKLVEPPKGKYFLSGFPKAGLHMLTLMCSPLADPAPPDLIASEHWCGTFAWNSFGRDWVDVDRQLRRVANLAPGHYLKGHLGYKPEISEFMERAGVTLVFMYRDLRDVAVSQAQHILNAWTTHLRHPASKSYHALGSVDNVLSAVIEGLPPWPGLFERWGFYAPWLDEHWVCCVKYEDERREVARSVLGRGLERALEYANLGYEGQLRLEQSLFQNTIDEMVAASRQTHLSPTFRKGQPGEWQEHFTEEHKDLFKSLDVDDWLIRLGYEDDEDW